MMNRRGILGAVLGLAFTMPLALHAHEGHVHKVMGTVTSRQDTRIDLKTQEGKSVTVVVDAKTTFLRGKQKVDASAVKVGDRMLVEVAGEKDMTAKVITLAPAPIVVRK